MNRIDWVIVRRLLGSIALTITVLFGLVLLVEALNTTRFAALAARDGLEAAVAAIGLAAARWIIGTLPLTVLVGAIAGLLSLQASREMTVIKSSGRSVWQLLRAPLAVTVVGGLAVALLVDTAVVQANRTLSPAAANSGTTGTLWLEEKDAGTRYILEAGFVHSSGDALGAVTVFMLDTPRDRIEAEAAELRGGEWVFATATRFRSNRVPETLADFRLPTSSTPGDMRSRLSSVQDLTVYELAAALASRLNDPQEKAQTLTRFFRLLGLPLTLAGSLVIAFAFTAGYRRTNKYGGAVLYGIVLGFLVYVVTEMAGRAGDAGVMQPAVAVIGPAFVAIVIGVTVLLNKEDGRT